MHVVYVLLAESTKPRDTEIDEVRSLPTAFSPLTCFRFIWQSPA